MHRSSRGILCTWKETEGTERKHRSTRERARNKQLKGGSEGKERRAEIIQRNKPAESKCFADSARAAWSCLFQQYCRNKRLAPLWERRHQEPYYRGMLC